MTSIVAPIPSCSDADSKFVKEFWLKLKLIQEEEEQNGDELELKVGNDEEKEEEEEEVEEEEEGEFSFAGAFGDGTLISADEAFLNGQIRPVFPLFNKDLLLPEGEDRSQMPEEGSYCEWGGKTTAASSPEFVSKKSNSTGFSKLRRFRELVLRSNSDGKDKFVFLHQSKDGGESKKVAPAKKSAAATSKATVMKKKKAETTSSSSFEKIYARRKKEEGGRQRVSYLPYKQVGFFASVNGLSKNVHPY
ncbi:hypothetical protein LINPERPRIM_LOCUS31870 [Linum perenne]